MLGRSTLFLIFSFTVISLAHCQSSNPKIREAIEALTSDRYKDREQASDDLWQMGLKTEAALKRLAEGADAEARIRARRILRDFRYGVLPDTPPSVRAKIIAFRDGDPAKQAEAFGDLCADGSTEVLERLISLQPNSEQRQRWIRVMFRGGVIVKHYDDVAKVDALLDRTGDNQSKQWRVQTRAIVLFSPSFLVTLNKASKLDTLKTIVAETSVGQRDLYLDAMINGNGSLQTLVQIAGTEFVFGMLDQSNTQPLRDRAVLRLASNQAVMKVIVEVDGFSAFASRIKTLGSPGVIPTAIASALRQTSVIAAIHQQTGWDGLIAAADHVNDPKLRATVMGRILSDPVALQSLQTKDQWSKIVGYAKSQPTGEIQDAYLMALMQSKLFSNQSDDAEYQAYFEVWEMAATSSNAALQRLAIARIANPPSFARLIEDDQRLSKLIVVLESLDNNTVGLVSTSIFGQYKNIQLIRQTNKIDRFVRIICRMKQSRQTHILHRLFQAQDRNDPFDAAINLRIVLKQLDGPDRIDFLVAMANTPLLRMSKNQNLATLVFEGIIESSIDEADRTLAVFSNGGPLMKRLAESAEHRDWVSDRIPFASPDVSTKIGETLVQNRLFALHLNESLLDRLLKESSEASPELAERLLRALFRSTTVTELLGKSDRTKWFITSIESLGSEDAKATAAESLFSNYRAMRELIQDARFDDLLAIARSHTNERRRSQVLGKFMADARVIEHLMRSKERALLFSFANPQWSLQQRAEFANQVVGRHAAAQAIVQAGKFDALLDLVDELVAQPGVQGDVQRDVAPLVANMMGMSPLVDQLVKKDRFFGLVDLAQFDLPEHRSHLQRLVNNKAVISEFAKKDRLPELIGWLTTNPKQGRSFRNHALFSSTHLVEALAAKKQLDLLYDIVRHEPDLRWRHRLLESLVSNSQSVLVLVKHDQLTPISELIVRYAEPSKEGTIWGRVLNNRVIDHLLKEKRGDELWRVVDRRLDLKTRKTIVTRLFNDSSMVKQLVESGYQQRLFDWVNDPNFMSSQQRHQIVSKLYLNRLSAIEWIKAGKLDPWLRIAIDCPPSELRSFLSSVSVINPELFTDPKFVEGFEKLVLQQPENQQRWLFTQALNQAKLRWTMLGSGQSHKLMHWIKLAGDPPGAMADFLFSSSGKVAFAIHENRIDDARQILRQNADVDGASVHLASFYQQLGDLDLRIEELKQTETLEPHQQRNLIDFLRASGRSGEAARKAIEFEKLDLVTDLFAEARNWKEAAAWQKKAIDLDQRRATETVDDLSLLAIFQWYDEDKDGFSQTLSDMQTLCDELDNRRASEALALTLIRCDQPTKGFKLLMTVNPFLALQLRIARGQYDEAINELDFDEMDIETWLETFPTPNQKSASKWSRIELGTLAAELHVGAGKTELAMRIYEILRQRARAASSSNAKKKYRMHVAQSLWRSGQTETFLRSMIELGREPRKLKDNLFEVLQLDKSLASEMRHWWNRIEYRITKQRRDAGQRYPMKKRWTDEEAFAALNLFEDILNLDSTLCFGGRTWTPAQFVEDIKASQRSTNVDAYCLPFLRRHGLYDDVPVHSKLITVVAYQDRVSRAIQLATPPFPPIAKTEIHSSRKLAWPAQQAWRDLTRKAYELEQNESIRKELQQDLTWACIAKRIEEYPSITSGQRYQDVSITSAKPPN
ncbi:hypothetical protein LF1_29970 [Rubripirellula obstinata]|uniref:Uncharacterized protein n=1 Tax=Rubripirellula obstinata TaxID=406547 RepID=A0A5B1CGY3_9BACT|nr:hypothetical protein [Rubripirellula obstinata]KAA1260457.1 hypothetical protein LF1_29970 [Rubripirellula obstinata]